jgi:hypothetical protein
MAKSLCNACGETFKSVTGFDKHRVGSFGDGIYKPGDTVRKKPIGQTAHTRRCMTTEEMLGAGMSKNAQGLWIASAYDDSAHEEEK